MQEFGLIKIFTWNHLSEGLFFWVFPLFFCLYLELLSRGCWRSASCSGHDLIFVETAGKGQLPVSRAPSQPHIWPCSGGISWSLCPTVLGSLIPRSNKDSIDRPLNVLSLGLVSIKSHWTIPVLPPGPGKYFLLLLLPISRVTLL